MAELSDKDLQEILKIVNVVNQHTGLFKEVDRAFTELGEAIMMYIGAQKVIDKAIQDKLKNLGERIKKLESKPLFTVHQGDAK